MQVKKVIPIDSWCSLIKNNYKTRELSERATVRKFRIVQPDKNSIDSKNILELIKEFAGTWMSLNAYDRDSLSLKGNLFR